MSSHLGSGLEASLSRAHQVDLLESAVQRVADRLEELYPPLAPGGLSRAEGYLRTLSVTLERMVRGEDVGAVRERLSASPLFEPLSQAIAQELIRSPSDPESALATLAVLRVWSALRGEPSAAPEPRPEQAREGWGSLSGSGAVDLIVEVAHDFRSPLTSILFLAEALRDGNSGPVNDLQRSQLGLVYSAAFGLASIATDVVDLARRDKDLIDDEPERFALHEAFLRVERLVRPMVEEKRLELRIVVPDRWQITGHQHAVSRVLLNLTTNALKFTDEGSVELGVRPLSYGRIEFYVQDTGRGMTPQQQKELFQAFKSRSSRKQAGNYFSGSGIGLTIARRLLKAMGSDLSLDSSDERGTRFSFVLPSGQSTGNGPDRLTR